jgi:hypothetical protein
MKKECIFHVDDGSGARLKGDRVIMTSGESCFSLNEGGWPLRMHGAAL